MTKDEALKLALEAMILNNAEWKRLADSGDGGYWSAEEQDHYKQTEQAIAAIKEALAQPEQEPVVFNTLASLKHKKTVGPIERAMLNATPPQRTWVGLAEDEIVLIVVECAASHQHTDIHFARAIEAALKAKNT
jgi:hypothetical protein